jgi:formylglycine-generating enzyme required for sulfatase activity
VARCDPDGRRHWYVNAQEQTMVLVRSPASARSFVLAAKPVTVAQFQRFLQERPHVRHSYRKAFSPEPDGPIVSVTWHEAAQYCNWLSEKEGIPPSQWCYEEVAEGMKPVAGWQERTGYRLPSEAEWEQACRSGTVTDRFDGAAQELLPRYAWYLANAQGRAWPVGQKRPNDLGLFDMHGNVYVWCQDAGFGEDLVVQEGQAERLGSRETRTHVLRGGSFLNTAAVVRSAYRSGNRPSYRDVTVGVRVARTLP